MNDGAVHAYVLVAKRAQAHLDPARVGIEEGHVLEGARVEVGAHLLVDHAQHVAVEGRRHAGAVVVGGLEHGHVLHEIGAEQQAVIRPHQRPEVGEEAGARLRVEVADRPAEEGEQPPFAVGEVLEVALEVAHHAVHLETRVDARQLVGALHHDRLGAVHRHVAAQPPGARHRVQQGARLGRGARAELDKLLGLRQRNDLRRPAVQDLALAARRVVLGQARDAVEQLGPALVVEVLRRELLEVAREPGAHVVRDRLERVAGQVGVDADRPAHDVAHLKPQKI